jgi:hypothetical protein
MAAAESVAVAVTTTVPETVAPLLGARIDTTGTLPGRALFALTKPEQPALKSPRLKTPTNKRCLARISAALLVIPKSLISLLKVMGLKLATPRGRQARASQLG